MSEAGKPREFVVGGIASDRPFRVRRLGHVGLYVTDMEAALRFYRDGLGFTISDPLDLGENIEDPEVRRRVGTTVVYFMRHGTDHHSFVLFPKAMMNVLFGNPDWSGWSINQTSWQVDTLREVTEGIDWFQRTGVPLARFGRDIPGSNWHAYPIDPEGHTNEIFCGMEQIGWQLKSKPVDLFEHGRQYHGKAVLPHASEGQEIADAEARGVDLESGYRPEPVTADRLYDVGGLLLPRPFKIVKVGPERLFVRDLDAAVRFYVDVLGLRLTEEVVYRGHRAVFLRANADHHSLALYPIALRHELGLSQATTLLSIGVRLGDYAQLKDALPFLEAKGIRVIQLPAELRPGVDRSALAIDPDGHAVELYFQMEQIGWDGRPRTAALRRPVDEASWPETLDADEIEDSSEPFLGPLG